MCQIAFEFKSTLIFSSVAFVHYVVTFDNAILCLCIFMLYIFFGLCSNLVDILNVKHFTDHVVDF